MKDEFLPVKELLQFRYSLNPYIYTAAYQAYQTGISLCRPMYYDFAEKKEAYDFPGQYQFGNDMIISPITSPPDSLTRLTIQKIWIPDGKWIEWFSGSLLEGGNIIERKFSLQEIPVYVRAGAIIPMYPSTIKNLQRTIDT